MSDSDASRIVTDNSRVVLQIVVSLTDDSWGVSYDCNVLIVQATDAYAECHCGDIHLCLSHNALVFIAILKNLNWLD